MSTIHNIVKSLHKCPQSTIQSTFMERIHNIVDCGHLWGESTISWTLDICGQHPQYCGLWTFVGRICNIAETLPGLCRDFAETLPRLAETLPRLTETLPRLAGALPGLCRNFVDTAKTLPGLGSFA